MDSDLHSSLRDNFGFLGFRPGQIDAIQSILSGQHTLVVMPTGSGKSLIYQLAALHLPGITLVISPLIALMKDQVDSMKRRSIPAAFINSALSPGEQAAILKELAAGKYRLVYIAPERLRSAQFLNALQTQKIGLLVVDEAHCISEWGHDFRPDYLQIAKFRTSAGNPLTAALTATATPKVQEDIAALLHLPNTRRIITGFNRPNLELNVRYVSNAQNRLRALHGLLDERDDGAVIVYTGTRRDAEEVAEFVSAVVGARAQYYHGGLSADERTRIQEAFMAGDLPVIAATNAFGMGIDRPDVRQVIHFTMPGSLEAYYQEAGRAGRDQLPARATLLYSPEDRSLQEWFIENNTITVDDLRMLFNALRPVDKKSATITLDELSCLTGMHAVKIRVGLDELERAGAIERSENEGSRFRASQLIWNGEHIYEINARLKQHQEYRKNQLQRIIAYAESDGCRRAIILQHFGDRGAINAEVCCDNCQVKQSASSAPASPGELSQAERTALIVLDAVRRLPNNIGREKLVQVLRGSRAKDMNKFGYDKSVYYGRLIVYSALEMKQIIDQLVDERYLKVIGGQYPVLRLTPQGEAAVKTRASISLKVQRTFSKKEIDRARRKRHAGNTLEVTAALLQQGHGIDQVAGQRGLTPGTIYSHAAKLIAAGRVSLEVVVSGKVRQQIEDAIRQVGSVDYLFPIKELLPSEIDYNVIRCVVEDWKQRHGVTKSGVRPTGGENLPSQDETRRSNEDAIDAFLSRSHPRRLPGPWDAGWALGFHSAFNGAEWSRSQVGELAYRLKYQGDISVLPILVDQASSLLGQQLESLQVQAVVPVPSSKSRPNDAVNNFAEALAKRLAWEFLPVLAKSRQTSPQKELHTMAQKRANVAGAFTLRASVKNMRLLVVDDLFDSGATLEEIFSLLRHAGAARVYVLTLTRTIHSDA